MFISRLFLNPCNNQVRSEIKQPYEMHRTLLRAFPHSQLEVERNADNAAGVLFRVDVSPRDQKIVVLVQSQVAPDWSFLNDKRDARGHAYLLQPAECKTLALQLTVGQTLAFRLRANPTKRAGKSMPEKQGKRIGLRDEQAQLDWLKRKAEQGGFRVVRAIISRDEYIENEKAIPQKDKRHDLKIFSVQFDGILQIVDANTFNQTLARGIGSGKGFGFGLLSLAPT